MTNEANALTERLAFYEAAIAQVDPQAWADAVEDALEDAHPDLCDWGSCPKCCANGDEDKG